MKNVAVTQHLVDFTNRRRRYSQERGLFFHAVVKRQIGAVHQYGSAGVREKLLQTADVINVCVRTDDCFDRQSVPADEIHDAADFVARIEHQRLASYGIADDGAVALQHADWQGKMNQSGGACAVFWGLADHVFDEYSIE